MVVCWKEVGALAVVSSASLLHVHRTGSQLPARSCDLSHVRHNQLVASFAPLRGGQGTSSDFHPYGYSPAEYEQVKGATEYEQGTQEDIAYNAQASPEQHSERKRELIRQLTEAVKCLELCCKCLAPPS